ncbi:MAG TPA: hypothetical protein VHH10_16100 [Rubrobacteraceae bacterium]|nr:hypothetical protein [Rubrobacteraceae bacterium]
MGTTEIIGHIERELGMSETSRVTTFRGIREDADGGLRETTVEVLDAGKRAKGRRFAVNLRFEGGGERVIGNPAATLEEALADAVARLG